MIQTGTEILTLFHGWKKVEQLHPGEMLTPYDPTQMPAQFLRLSTTKVRTDLVELRAGDVSLICCRNQEIEVVSGAFDIFNSKWVKAEQLKLLTPDAPEGSREFRARPDPLTKVYLPLTRIHWFPYRGKIHQPVLHPPYPYITRFGACR